MMTMRKTMTQRRFFFDSFSQHTKFLCLRQFSIFNFHTVYRFVTDINKETDAHQKLRWICLSNNNENTITKKKQKQRANKRREETN